MKQRTWVEVDLSVLRENFRLCRDTVAPRPVMAVVKASAYGHGAVPVAQALWEEGVRDFAVATLEEGEELRRAGLGGSILILGYTPASQAGELVKMDLTQTVVSPEHGEALLREGLPVKCHVAIDTGMNRIGLDGEDPAFCEKEIRRLAKTLQVTGLFTHLCAADSTRVEDRAFTRRQAERFSAVARRVSDLDLVTHCLNSAGSLGDVPALPGPVRLGIVLYGLSPDPAFPLPPGIRPALSWKSTLSMVKNLAPGETVGYGRTFRAEKPMRLATVCAGYADGVSRLLSHKGEVLIRGRRAGIVGLVCMDQFMVDVSHIPDAAMGDVVTLLGHSGDEEIRAEDQAKLIGTIGYEVLCDISPRVERVYQ